ncbi:MAG: hypothetical protein EOP84_05675, partial [Verrucomicrobiaceae bacterium]
MNRSRTRPSLRPGQDAWASSPTATIPASARITVIQNLKDLLAGLAPTLNPGTYAFVTAPADIRIPPDQIIASVREPDGLSLVIPEPLARSLDLPVPYPAAWITLTVHSDLAAIG